MFRAQKLGSTFRAGLPITRTEKLEDGRLVVEGCATSEALDGDGTVLDYDASKQAFMVWKGNIREQHDPKKAVGRALEITHDDAARSILVRAFISAGAADTQAKILDGTLGGFSVHGVATELKMEKAANGKPFERVTKWLMDELSVVDVGSNPDTNGIKLVKADGSSDVLDTDEEDADAKKKKADEEAEVEKAAAAKAELEKAAAAAPVEKPVAKHYGTYGTDLDDLADAIGILRSLAYLRSAEAAEGDAANNDVAILDRAIAAMREFVGEEAAELSMPPAEELALAAKGERGQLLERTGTARLVRTLLAKAATATPVPAPEPIALDLTPITKATSETEGRISKTLGELGDQLKALRETVDVIAAQPVPGGPFRRDSPEQRRTLGTGASEVETLQRMLDRESNPETQAQLRVSLARAKAAQG